MEQIPRLLLTVGLWSAVGEFFRIRRAGRRIRLYVEALPPHLRKYFFDSLEKRASALFLNNCQLSTVN